MTILVSRAGGPSPNGQPRVRPERGCPGPDPRRHDFPDRLGYPTGKSK